MDNIKMCLQINPKYGNAWREIGEILLEDNNIVNASKYFKKALVCHPDDSESKLALGNCEYMLENYKAAISIYEELMSEKSLKAYDQLYYNLANSHYMINNIPQAILYYNQSLTLNTLNSECYYNLGNAYCLQENFKQALDVFLKSVKIDNTNASAYYNLGTKYIPYYIIYLFIYLFINIFIFIADVFK